MRCDGFERFLAYGATRPFLARSTQGDLWVIKAHGNPLGTKAIFNEYVAGLLAKAIGLPWPTVSVVELAPSVSDRLNQEGLHVQSRWAIGLHYLAGLRRVDWPPGGYKPVKDFPQRNAEHIRSLFPNPATHAGFYGKAVFDSWLLLEDTKYDTLCIGPDGYPIFLDASCALGGLDWDPTSLKWDLAHIDIRSPYLRGIISDMNQFDSWLGRVELVGQSFIHEIFNSIPEKWGVPNDYRSVTATFLTTTQTDFLPLFRQWIES